MKKVLTVISGLVLVLVLFRGFNLFFKYKDWAIQEFSRAFTHHADKKAEAASELKKNSEEMTVESADSLKTKLETVRKAAPLPPTSKEEILSMMKAQLAAMIQEGADAKLIEEVKGNIAHFEAEAQAELKEAVLR